MILFNNNLKYEILFLDNLPAAMKPSTPKNQPHIMPLNGILTKSNSAPALSMQKHSPKKVLPITLSLSGPAQSQSLSVINAINPGPAAFEMSVTGKILELPPVKTPVTQILHRTLQQRQQALLTQRVVKPATTVARGIASVLVCLTFHFNSKSLNFRISFQGPTNLFQATCLHGKQLTILTGSSAISTHP